MGTVNSSCHDKPFSNEGYVTPETKYDLQNLTRATFPMRVNVFSSQHGGLLQDVMYQDIDVYFQKETRMLVAVSEDGRPRLIPFNSAVKCSVIDDFGAGADTGTCLQGRTFDSSEELMMATPLPKVVSSEHGYYYKDSAHTVERDDLMIIKKLQVDEASGKPCTLECREACTDEDRWIDRGIQCTFTTNVNKITCVNPNVLFNHLRLPVRIVLKLDDKNDDSAAMQPSMNGSIYTVTNVITKRSVVCSVRYSTGAKKLIEVYLDVPIEFEIIKLTELEMQKLRVEAWQVFNEFSSSQVGRVVVNPADEIQSVLLHATRTGDESGITLLPPEPSFSKEFPAFLIKRVSAQRKKSIKDVPGSKGVLKMKLRGSEAPMQCSSEKLVRKKSSVNYGKLLCGVWTEKTLGFASSENISQQTLPNDHDYVDMDVGASTPSIADKMETIGENIPQRERLNENQAASIPNEFDQSLVASENRKILLRYTSKDVLGVLSQLRLSQYRDVFEKEAITGSLLLDLHDERILIELGMNSRLHQLKIQRLLDGRESVGALMTNETLL